ncbi:MAG: putative gas vesicle synthesis protein [Gemmatimonadetes bacterium]|nr:putative gas vesicle synthesis protein [Gemmatimonadota bacterium]
MSDPRPAPVDETASPDPSPLAPRHDSAADLPVDRREAAEEMPGVLAGPPSPEAAQAPVEAAPGAAQPAPDPRGPRALLAVVPVESDTFPAWDAADVKLGVTLVPYRDLAALLVPSSADPAGAADPQRVKERHWEVHRALLRGSVAPAPLGVVFESDDEVVRFLTEAYATLKGALSRVEGRWEFRLHVDLVESALSESLALDLVTHIYAELRRIAHSAIPFPRDGKRLLSAAFLVDRTSSSSFQDRVVELGRVNGALDLDLTGPWPPYDFVQMKT